MITLKVLTDGFGVSDHLSRAADDGTTEQTKIQDLEFECTREEITYFMQKIKGALATFENK